MAIFFTHETLQYHQTSRDCLLEFKTNSIILALELIITPMKIDKKSKFESLNFNIYYKIN